MNSLALFIKKIYQSPESITFPETIKIIDDFYQYTPSSFTNGKDDELILNSSGENQGSCKIFAFAKLHKLNKLQTLNCFGDYYRQDVLQHLEHSDHSNIRTFIKHGWSHIHFSNDVLIELS